MFEKVEKPCTKVTSDYYSNVFCWCMHECRFLFAALWLLQKVFALVASYKGKRKSITFYTATLRSGNLNGQFCHSE